MVKLNRCLPVGTPIDNYVIEQILGGGGFSIVYLAREAGGKRRFVVKEYMPQKIARRMPNGEVAPADEQQQEIYIEGRKLFFKEASALATLKHPNIVEVVSFFQANGTVYMVMRYEAGTNLQQYIKTRRGRLSETFLRTVFPQLLDGLKAIHGKGLLHLDIKPGNVHLRPGGRPLLLDFGAVHTMSLSRQHQARQVVTPGYAPSEQYDLSGYVGPWTDLYATGATMRTCIEGVPPPAAHLRCEKDVMRPAQHAFRKRYSQELLGAIDWAMEVDPLLRPQNVNELLTRLNIEPEAAATDAASGTVIDKLVTNFPWNR